MTEATTTRFVTWRSYIGRAAGVLVNLSRNFGKEIALTAGLIRATGEAIVVIAADLRIPPNLSQIWSRHGGRGSISSVRSA